MTIPFVSKVCQNWILLITHTAIKSRIPTKSEYWGLQRVLFIQVMIIKMLFKKNNLFFNYCYQNRLGFSYHCLRNSYFLTQYFIITIFKHIENLEKMKSEQLRTQQPDFRIINLLFMALTFLVKFTQSKMSLFQVLQFTELLKGIRFCSHDCSQHMENPTTPRSFLPLWSQYSPPISSCWQSLL